jgi:hypothetical protein
MATQIKPKQVPQDLPQAEPKAVTTPELSPSIEYIGEGAKDIKFTINPKATRYVVNANGMVMEYL